MTADEWKAASHPIYLRLFQLGEKAQDLGLTDEERAEREGLDRERDGLLREFLVSSRSEGDSPCR